MKTFTEMFEEDFQARIDNGERVYLSEVYKELGFETLYPNRRHAFWDKNGFHETDEDVKIVNNNVIHSAIEQAYNELGRGKIQPNKLFNVLAQNGYIDLRLGETDISEWSEISDEEILKIHGLGPTSIKFFKRTIDILNGADPLPKQMYTVTITFEELEQLRHIYEQKQNEAELLKRIISNATLGN